MDQHLGHLDHVRGLGPDHTEYGVEGPTSLLAPRTRAVWPGAIRDPPILNLPRRSTGNGIKVSQSLPSYQLLLHQGSLTSSNGPCSLLRE